MILRRTFLSIFPLLVLGSFSTINTSWKQATGPIYLRTREINCFYMPSLGCPFLMTMKPTGISPLSSSILATTAASEIELWDSRISSMAAVDRRWPAVLMISSSRVITFR